MTDDALSQVRSHQHDFRANARLSDCILTRPMLFKGAEVSEELSTLSLLVEGQAAGGTSMPQDRTVAGCH